MPQLESVPARVDSFMNYIVDTGSRPAYYLYVPESGPVAPPGVDKHDISFIDLREQMDAFTLDRNGFTFVDQDLPEIDFLDADIVARDYYEICTALVKTATGATRVLAFDHNVRDKGLAAESRAGVREPVRFAHNDYTEKSGPQRVRELMGEAAEEVLQHRYLFINVWRPLRGPVLDVPLAICDATSLSPADFVATDLKYADRTGEIYSIRHNQRHRWYFLGGMQNHEIMLIKCFDSASDGRARYTAHGAFRDPFAAADRLPRRSIEVRTLAVFLPD